MIESPKREAFIDESKWWIDKSYDGLWHVAGPLQPDGSHYHATYDTFEEAVQYVKEQINER